MIREPQDLADELAAERVYNDKTIPVVDVPDLFGEPAFDVCTDGCHYAQCGRYQPFEKCRFGSHWHYLTGSFEAFRYIGKCPEASEYGEPAEQACVPPEDRD